MIIRRYPSFLIMCVLLAVLSASAIRSDLPALKQRVIHAASILLIIQHIHWIQKQCVSEQQSKGLPAC